jgi:hypothetical protein
MCGVLVHELRHHGECLVHCQPAVVDESGEGRAEAAARHVCMSDRELDDPVVATEDHELGAWECDDRVGQESGRGKGAGDPGEGQVDGRVRVVLGQCQELVLISKWAGHCDPAFTMKT